jgi:hypothetical protein
MRYCIVLSKTGKWCIVEHLFVQICVIVEEGTVALVLKRVCCADVSGSSYCQLEG